MQDLLRVVNLKKYFTTGSIFERRTLRAVDGVDLALGAGDCLGVVGESGCGKTTVAKCVLRLVEPTAGEVRFAGQDVLRMDGRRLRELRREMQIVFQDPYGSLNPKMTVGEILAEPLLIHGLAAGRRARERVAALLQTVGLDPGHAARFPHEFSGGQRQRVAIARALATSPKLVVCDEPLSALDVSIQSQIINLLMELRDRHHLTYLFISHSLPVVYYLCNRVVVMYMGKVVESGTVDEVYSAPLHPYTRALLASMPEPRARRAAGRKERMRLRGEPPNPFSQMPGCRLANRCDQRVEECGVQEPGMRLVEGTHWLRCHLSGR